MPVRSSYGLDAYHAGEAHAVIRPAYGTPSKTLLLHHGLGGRAAWSLPMLAGDSKVVDAGVLWATADNGTGRLWGSTADQTRMTELHDYVKASHEGHTKVTLYGVSMGSLTVLNWARNNPSKVNRVVCIIPALNLSDFHANPTYTAEIEAIYGGAPPSTHSPHANAAAYSGIGFPIHLFYSSNDSMADPARVVSFAAASGASIYNMGPWDHSVNPAFEGPIVAALAA